MRTKNLLAASLMAAVLPAARAEIVYNNSTTDLSQRLTGGTVEIGDELVLGGTGRHLTDFSFEYYGISFSGNERAQVRLYANDGLAYSNNPAQLMPNTVLYDSGSFAVSATPRNTLNFSVSGGSLPNTITFPDHITLSVQFTGIEAGESAGVDLYDPPTVGSSLNDYWYHDPSLGWQVRTNVGPVLNFGAQISAVPEPSMWALFATAGACGYFMLARRRRP